MCTSYPELFLPISHQRSGWITREPAMVTGILVIDAHYHTGKVARPPASTVDAMYVFPYPSVRFREDFEVESGRSRLLCFIRGQRAWCTFPELTTLDDADSRIAYSIFQESRRSQLNASTGSTSQTWRSPPPPNTTTTQPHPHPHPSPQPSITPLPTQQNTSPHPSHRDPPSTQRQMPLPGLRGGGFTEQDLEDLLDQGRRQQHNNDKSRNPEIHTPAPRPAPAYSDKEKARMAAELRDQGVPRFLSLEPWRRLDETLKGMRRERRLE